MALAGCTATPAPASTAATTGGTGGSIDPAGSPTPDAAAGALTALMATRSRALQTTDPAAWAATIADPLGPDGTAEAAAYRGLIALGVRELDVSEVRSALEMTHPAAAAPPTVATASPALRAQTWTASMRLGYAIPGFDRGVRWVSRTVTLRQVAGQWLIQRWLGPDDRWEAFDLESLQVVRTPRSLVAGSVGVDSLRAGLAEVEDGQDRVAAVLGHAVPAVIVVPETSNQAAHLLGESGTTTGPAATDPAIRRPPLTGQVAATTHGARDPNAPAMADRVVLDPAGMARLTPAGRRVVLTHELTHVSVRASTLHDLPLWLSEGFAEWVGFRDAGLDTRVVAARLLAQVRASGPPPTLPTPTDFAGTTGDPAAAYQGAWLAASRIATLAGRSGLVGLVRRLGAVAGTSTGAPTPVGLGDGLALVVGQSEPQFVRGWQSELVALART